MRKPHGPQVYELDSMPPENGDARKFVRDVIAPLFYEWTNTVISMAAHRTPISVDCIRRQEIGRNACAAYTIVNALTIILADKIPNFNNLQECKSLFKSADGPWIELAMRKTFGDVAFHQASEIYGALNCKLLQAALKR